MDLWKSNPYVVIASDVKDYPQSAALQRSREGSLEALSKPVAVRDLLKQLSVFKNCSEIELRKLVEIGHRRRLNPTEILYREGD